MTSGYVIAGYALTWGTLAAYLWRLSVRSQRTQRALDTERATLD